MSLNLGNTEQNVSALCMGTMYFGCREEEALCFKLLDQYIDAGGNFLDTANTYSYWISSCRGGESERTIGKWMKKRKNRSKLFIASKVGFGYPGVQGGLRKHQIVQECEKSLKRLGSDYLDLYYAHVDDRDTPLEETLDAFTRLIDLGKIRFIGASNYVTWRLEHAHWISKCLELADFCCVQQRFSYVRPNPGGRFHPQVVANDEQLEYLMHRHLTLLAYSPLLSGAYTRRERKFPDQYSGSDTVERLQIISKMAHDEGVTVSQVVLAWMIQNTPSIIPVIGVSNTVQLIENLKSFDVILDSSQINVLNNACTGGTAW